MKCWASPWLQKPFVQDRKTLQEHIKIRTRAFRNIESEKHKFMVLVPVFESWYKCTGDSCMGTKLIFCVDTHRNANFLFRNMMHELSLRFRGVIPLIWHSVMSCVLLRFNNRVDSIWRLLRPFANGLTSNGKGDSIFNYRSYSYLLFN